jgi:hypothetical protein
LDTADATFEGRLKNKKPIRRQEMSNPNSDLRPAVRVVLILAARINYCCIYFDKHEALGNLQYADKLPECVHKREDYRL